MEHMISPEDFNAAYDKVKSGEWSQRYLDLT